MSLLKVIAAALLVIARAVCRNSRHQRRRSEAMSRSGKLCIIAAVLFVSALSVALGFGGLR